jgi:ketopantoate reductase
MDRYEWAIWGAGALGSIIGAHLSRSGHQVVLLARGQRAHATFYSMVAGIDRIRR